MNPYPQYAAAEALATSEWCKEETHAVWNALIALKTGEVSKDQAIAAIQARIDGLTALVDSVKAL